MLGNTRASNQFVITKARRTSLGGAGLARSRAFLAEFGDLVDKIVLGANGAGLSCGVDYKKIVAPKNNLEICDRPYSPTHDVAIKSYS